MALANYSLFVLTLGALMRIAPAVALLAITSGCYTPLRTYPYDASSGGGSGAPGNGGISGTGGGSDAAAGADSDSPTDAGTGDGSTKCSSGSKLCDGKCIPSEACCGPCSCDGLPHSCGPNRN